MPSEAVTRRRLRKLEAPKQIVPARRRSPVRNGVLDPIHPNAGVEAAYRKKLLKQVEQMHDSLYYWLRAAYRQNEPEVAQLARDAAPATELKQAIRLLVRRWQRRFDKLAPDLADYFATEVSNRSDAALQSMLRRGGFSVKFTRTPAIDDVIKASVQENVALIKSIAQQHLTQVEGMVMRSVQTGRDLHTLSLELRKQFGVTKRRAELIARDQNNKATAAIQRTRQLELGVTKAVWVHSGGGKEPRPSHVKAGADKVVYDVARGWFDPHERKRIWPGTLINCRCVSKPVIPGFS